MNTHPKPIWRLHKLRFWLAVIIFFAALVLLSISILPPTTIQQKLIFPPVSLPTPTSIGELLLWAG
jgi:hypothetical protein